MATDPFSVTVPSPPLVCSPMKILITSFSLVAVLSAAIAAAPPETIRQVADSRAKIVRVAMAPDTSYLTAEERQVVNLLLQAAHKMSDIYMVQNGPDNV